MQSQKITQPKTTQTKVEQAGDAKSAYCSECGCYILSEGPYKRLSPNGYCMKHPNVVLRDIRY